MVVERKRGPERKQNGAASEEVEGKPIGISNAARCSTARYHCSRSKALATRRHTTVVEVDGNDRVQHSS